MEMTYLYAVFVVAVGIGFTRNVEGILNGIPIAKVGKPFLVQIAENDVIKCHGIIYSSSHVIVPRHCPISTWNASGIEVWYGHPTVFRRAKLISSEMINEEIVLASISAGAYSMGQDFTSVAIPGQKMDETLNKRCACRVYSLGPIDTSTCVANASGTYNYYPVISKNDTACVIRNLDIGHGKMCLKHRHLHPPKKQERFRYCPQVELGLPVMCPNPEDPEEEVAVGMYTGNGTEARFLTVARLSTVAEAIVNATPIEYYLGLKCLTSTQCRGAVPMKCLYSTNTSQFGYCLCENPTCAEDVVAVFKGRRLHGWQAITYLKPIKYSRSNSSVQLPGPDSLVDNRGGYIYFDGLPNSDNNRTYKAGLLADFVGFNARGDLCLKFNYHMHGSNNINLKVLSYFKSNFSWEPTWSQTGEQGRSWHTTAIRLDYPGTRNVGKVAFWLTSLPGNNGSVVAIDNLELRYINYWEPCS